MFCAVAPRIEKTAAVVVTEAVRRSYLSEGLHDYKHFPDHFVEAGGNLGAIAGSEQARMQKEIERIDVVVQGLLEIDSVGPNLALGLLLNDPPALLSPRFGGRNLRAESSNEQQSNRFAQ